VQSLASIKFMVFLQRYEHFTALLGKSTGIAISVRQIGRCRLHCVDMSATLNSRTWCLDETEEDIKKLVNDDFDTVITVLYEYQRLVEQKYPKHLKIFNEFPKELLTTEQKENLEEIINQIEEYSSFFNSDKIYPGFTNSMSAIGPHNRNGINKWLRGFYVDHLKGDKFARQYYSDIGYALQKFDTILKRVNDLPQEEVIFGIQTSQTEFDEYTRTLINEATDFHKVLNVLTAYEKIFEEAKEVQHVIDNLRAFSGRLENVKDEKWVQYMITEILKKQSSFEEIRDDIYDEIYDMENEPPKVTAFARDMYVHVLRGESFFKEYEHQLMRAMSWFDSLDKRKE